MEQKIEVSAFDIKLTQLLAEGYAMKEIAAHVGLSARTVEGHFLRLRKRLACKNGSHLVAIFFRAELIK